MRLTRAHLRRLIKEELNVLVEQEEEDPFGTEEDEEGAEEEGDETDEEAEGDEETEGGEDAEEEDEEEVEEVEPLGDEEQSLAKTVDDELNSIFIDFETDALKSANWSEERKEEVQVESRRSLAHVLFEQDELPKIDMETFTADVARLIKNYDSLLDMKAIIMKKAQDFILDKYGKEQVEELLSILELRYDLTLEMPEDEINPIAVGASTTAAEGGA